MARRECLRRAVTGLFVLGVAGTLTGGMLTGCATPSTENSCTLVQVILPASATANHSAAAPGNQVSFGVGFALGPGSASTCGIPALVIAPSEFTWVSSDPINAPISNVAATAGVATCVGATTVPATISVSSTGSIQVAKLTCE